MSVSHGHSTIGGIEYGGCGVDKKNENVSHQLGKLKGYGDAHQFMQSPQQKYVARKGNLPMPPLIDAGSMWGAV